MLEIGTGTMTMLQEQTHFAFWAALKSPLIIGANIQNISDSSMEILRNKEIIAINQDKLGVAVNYLPEMSAEDEYQIWAGPLGSGKSRYVVLVQNYGSKSVDISIKTNSLPGLKSYANRAELVVRDVWEGRNLGKLGHDVDVKNIKVDQVKVLVLSNVV